MNALEKLISKSPELQRAAVDIKLREERDARLKRAETDFQFFCSYYLPEYFFCPLAEYQIILNKIAETKTITEEQSDRIKSMVPEDFKPTVKPMEKIKLLLDVEPRGHGKSTRWTFAFALWCALFSKYMFPLVIGANKDEAMLHIDNIRQAIESNERIIDDFGFMAGSPWNKKELNLSNGVRIMAQGKGGSLRGRRNKQFRPDLVLIDDLFTDKESDSMRVREQVDRWFKRTVIPLGKEAIFILVNTITNEDDLASRILRKISNENTSGWVALRFSAEMPGEVPLWKERYTWQDLLDIRNEIGSPAYSQEYLGRAISDEDRMFKMQWIRQCSRSEIPERLIRYEGIDPATGAHDLSAVVDGGRERGSAHIYVTDSHGEKESTGRFMERLIQRYRLLRYRRALMESVAFQEVYRKQIIEEAAKRKLALPIKGARTGRASKEARAMAMQPLIENGTVIFGPGNQDLIDQLLAFPNGAYDDLVDALYYMLKASGFLKGKLDDGEGTIISDKRIDMNLRRRLNI